jgi:single-strand DNA-binding protein
MYQQIMIMGHLGKDPEMRYTESGKAVTTFSVAVGRKFTQRNGEKVDETTWFRVSVFGNLAEVCNKFLKKGSAVLVPGILKSDPETGGPRVYQRQDGTYAASYEITADTVKFISEK